MISGQNKTIPERSTTECPYTSPLKHPNTRNDCSNVNTCFNGPFCLLRLSKWPEWQSRTTSRGKSGPQKGAFWGQTFPLLVRPHSGLGLPASCAPSKRSRASGLRLLRGRSKWADWPDPTWPGELGNCIRQSIIQVLKFPERRRPYREKILYVRWGVCVCVEFGSGLKYMHNLFSAKQS